MEKLIKLSEIPNSQILLDPKWIFTNSMKDNYNIGDVIIKYIALESYLNGDKYGIELYNQMQKRRIELNNRIPKSRDDGGKRYFELIESIMTNGYDLNSAVVLNKDFCILDGTHRLAIALYLNLDKISVKFDNTSNDVVDYSTDWFEKSGLEEHSKIIKKKYSEMK